MQVKNTLIKLVVAAAVMLPLCRIGPDKQY